MEYQINTISGAGLEWIRLKDIRYISSDEPHFPSCLVLWGQDKELPVGIFPLAGMAACYQVEEDNNATDKGQ